MRAPLLILLAVALPAVAAENAGQIDPAAFEQRFKSADKDKDGKLTRKEAYEAFPRMPEFFNEIDRNRDDSITLEEVRRLEAKRIEAALDAGSPSARFNRNDEPKEFTSRVEERRYYQSQFYESLLSDKNRARSRGEPVADSPTTPILKGTF